MSGATTTVYIIKYAAQRNGITEFISGDIFLNHPAVK